MKHKTDRDAKSVTKKKHEDNLKSPVAVQTQTAPTSDTKEKTKQQKLEQKQSGRKSKLLLLVFCSSCCLSIFLPAHDFGFVSDGGS